MPPLPDTERLSVNAVAISVKLALTSADLMVVPAVKLADGNENVPLEFLGIAHLH